MLHLQRHTFTAATRHGVEQCVEKGETSNNMLTICPIQSILCGKDLLMMEPCFETELLRIPIVMSARELRKKSILKKRTRGTLPTEIPLAIATGIY